jgi:hypothetical protein
MNFRRGLIRVWLPLTLIWLAVQTGRHFPELAETPWRAVMWIFFLPPVGLGVILFALGWALAGFKGGAPR